MFVLGKRMEQLEMWIGLVLHWHKLISLMQISIVNINSNICMVFLHFTFILSNNWHTILDV